MSEFNITFQTGQDFNVTLESGPEASLDMGTVYVPNPPAVLYEPQELTDAQQEQARENISAASESALTTHTGNTTIHVTASDKAVWDTKYDKPSGGIPATDLSEAVQDSLGLADAAMPGSTPVVKYSAQTLTTGEQKIARDNIAAALSKDTTDGAANLTAAIPFGKVSSLSTSTVFTATVPGITELRDGVACYLMNGVVTSASGWTLNVNGLGAKPVYQTMAAASRSTTIFNIAYTMLFIYNEKRVEGGCWDIYYGYNSNDNTIAYNVRVGVSPGVMKSALYRYEIVFSLPDGKLEPANNVSNKPTTYTKALTTESFNPFEPIYYYGTTSSVSAGSAPSTSYMWTQYSGVDIRYSFNNGSTLTSNKPVYLRCVPQGDCLVKLDGNDCLVQALPATADGKVYIYLGKAYSTYQIFLNPTHPIFEYINGGIHIWNA